MTVYLNHFTVYGPHPRSGVTESMARVSVHVLRDGVWVDESPVVPQQEDPSDRICFGHTVAGPALVELFCHRYNPKTPEDAKTYPHYRSSYVVGHIVFQPESSPFRTWRIDKAKYDSLRKLKEFDCSKFITLRAIEHLRKVVHYPVPPLPQHDLVRITKQAIEITIRKWPDLADELKP